MKNAVNMAEAAELAACAGDYDTTAVYMDGNAVIQNMKKSLRQILRKVRQDNGESRGEIIEKKHLVIECNNIYCYFIRRDLFAT